MPSSLCKLTEAILRSTNKGGKIENKNRRLSQAVIAQNCYWFWRVQRFFPSILTLQVLFQPACPEEGAGVLGVLTASPLATTGASGQISVEQLPQFTPGYCRNNFIFFCELGCKRTGSESASCACSTQPFKARLKPRRSEGTRGLGDWRDQATQHHRPPFARQSRCAIVLSPPGREAHRVR